MAAEPLAVAAPAPPSLARRPAREAVRQQHLEPRSLSTATGPDPKYSVLLVEGQRQALEPVAAEHAMIRLEFLGPKTHSADGCWLLAADPKNYALEEGCQPQPGALPCGSLCSLLAWSAHQ